MIVRCPSCAAQVDEAADRCPSCHWDFNQFKRIPPAGEAVNPTVGAPPKDAPPKLPAAKHLPPPPTVDPSILPKARARAEEPGAGLTPTRPPEAGANFKIPQIGAPPLELTPFSEATQPVEERHPAKRRPAEKPSQPPPERPAERPLPKERHEPGEPPKTVIRSAKSEPPPPPKPVLGSSLELRADDDAAARFRRRSAPVSDLKRSVSRRFAGLEPIWLVVAAGAVVAALTVVVVRVVVRSDVPTGQPAAAEPAPFARGSTGMPDGTELLGEASNLVSGAVQGKASPAAPIQRVALDPLHPELGPVAVPQGVSAAAVAEQLASGSRPEPPAPPPPPLAAAPSAAPKAPSKAAAPPPKPAVPRPQPAAAASPAPPKAAPAKEAAPPPEPVAKLRDWVFQGQVYDIITLQPVYGVSLTFKDPFGRLVGKASTGDNGHYRVRLPALETGGYAVTLSHPDYRAHFLEDVYPPVRTLPEDQRRALAGARPVDKPWLGSVRSSVRRDLVVTPKVVDE